jgi:putative flavoprotein involved in K+ transport
VEKLDLVIVGAGSAGLATAALLREDGIDSVLLEAGPEPGAAWRTRYDRLRLHTPRLLSGLPGLRIPRRYGRWVARDGLLEYFHAYVDEHKLEVRTNTRVERLEPDGDGGWWIETARGQIQAKTVIVATGYNGRPFIPDWPGRETFAGELIHSSQYANPAPFRDRDVLTVGVGNSGAEIATDVAEGGASRSRISVRTPPQILRRATAGIPAQLVGIAIKRLPPHWVDPTPVLDGGIVDAVKRGAVEVVAAVEGFDGADVLLADGTRYAPDAVIAATGFRAGIDELVGHLGVLAPSGLPLKTDGEPALPGLWFVGFRPTLGGQLREGTIAARHVAAAVAASM